MTKIGDEVRFKRSSNQSLIYKRAADFRKTQDKGRNRVKRKVFQ